MIQDEILHSFRNKNILVTGGTGMIGRQVVELLSQVKDINIKTVSLDKGISIPFAECIYGDLTDFNYCKTITKDMDYVFHLAGVCASVHNAKTKAATHLVPMIQMNTNLLEACRFNHIENLVFTSTIGAYSSAQILREEDYTIASHPMDTASWAKRIAELQIELYKEQYGLNYRIVRLSNVYGPGDSFHADSLVIPSLLYKIYHQTENPIVIWGDGSAKRDFTYSKDIAEGIILAMYYNLPHKFINLGSGSGYSIKELVETLCSFLNFNYSFDITKPTGDKLRIMDISLARRNLGYNPTTKLQEGLKMTWEWFINNQNEYLNKKNYFKNDM